MLSDLTLNLELDSAEIHVITSRLLYNSRERVLDRYEYLDGVHVHRVWTSTFGRANLIGRALDYLSFHGSSLLCMLKRVRRGDIVVAKTDPPLISVFAAFVTHIKGASLINWLQDLFPEVAAELRVRGLSSGPLYRFLKGLRNWSLRTATANVVLGDRMAKRIEREIGQPEKTRVIPNWVIGGGMRPVAKEQNPLVAEWGLEKKFVLGYSGNLGRAHDCKTILDAAMSLQRDPSILFLFIGGGAGYEWLKTEVEQRGMNNVLFKPYQPAGRLAYSLSVPDAHLISLDPRLEGLIVPSKLYGILAVGRPMIFLGDRWGEIGSLIDEYELGFAVEMGDSEPIVDAVQTLRANGETRQRMGMHARILFESRFVPENSYRSWSALLSERVTWCNSHGQQ